MGHACDYSVARPDPAVIVAAGIEGVVRYCVDGSGPAGKAIAKAEYEALLAEGLHVVLVQETGPQPAMRGAPGGTADADAAEQVAAALGYPPDAAIYYVAEDPNPVALGAWPTVAAYFQAVHDVNPKRPLGGYGSQPLVAHLQSLGLVVYGWMVAPWSTVVTGMHLAQETGGVPAELAGLVDMDIVLQADWGQAPRPTPPTPAPPPTPQGAPMAKPCVFNTPDHNEQVFYVDANGLMHHHYWVAATNTWSPDEPLGAGWEASAELVWATDSNNTYQVWGVRADGKIAQVYWSGAEWVTQPLG